MVKPAAFEESESFKRAVLIAEDLTHTELWHLLRKLEGVLVGKQHALARIRGESNEASYHFNIED